MWLHDSSRKKAFQIKRLSGDLRKIFKIVLNLLTLHLISSITAHFQLSITSSSNWHQFLVSEGLIMKYSGYATFSYLLQAASKGQFSCNIYACLHQ